MMKKGCEGEGGRKRFKISSADQRQEAQIKTGSGSDVLYQVRVERSDEFPLGLALQSSSYPTLLLIQAIGARFLVCAASFCPSNMAGIPRHYRLASSDQTAKHGGCRRTLNGSDCLTAQFIAVRQMWLSKREPRSTVQGQDLWLQGQANLACLACLAFWGMKESVTFM